MSGVDSSPSSFTARPVQFPAAAQPDLLYSLQKDEFYTSALKEDVLQLANDIFGERIQRFRLELGVLSDLSYHTCTNVLHHVSLGDEYTDLRQVDGRVPFLKLPSRIQRILHGLLSIVVPYLQKKVLLLFGSGGDRSRIMSWIVYVLEMVQRHVPTVSKLHLAAFYLCGVYVKPGRRATRIRHVSLQASQASPTPYKALGLLLLVQLAISGLLKLHSWLKMALALRKQGHPQPVPSVSSSSSSLSSSSTPVSSEQHLSTPEQGQSSVVEREYQGEGQPAPDSVKCILCLEPMCDPTATECGHVFCWRCITECCTMSGKSECPMCRQDIFMQRLVPLCNYA